MATISFRVEDEIKERLDRLVEERGLNASHLFRQALLDKLSEIEPHGQTENRLLLTVKERLSLALQLRTLAAVAPESEKVGLATQIEALQSGYEYHYRDLIVAFDNGLSRRACTEVLDILEMFSEMHWGFEKLDEKEGINELDIQFPGFDGNTESRQLGYVNYFLFDLGRYESLHDQIESNRGNSHCPMVETYQKMLRVFFNRRRMPHPLSAADIKAILAVRGY